MRFSLFKKNNEKRKGSNPHRDWLIILAITGVLFTVIVLYNVYVFRQVAEGRFMLPSSEEIVTKTLDKDSLRQTFLIIETKKQKLEDALNGEVKVGDPSL